MEPEVYRGSEIMVRDDTTRHNLQSEALRTQGSNALENLFPVEVAAVSGDNLVPYDRASARRHGRAGRSSRDSNPLANRASLFDDDIGRGKRAGGTRDHYSRPILPRRSSRKLRIVSAFGTPSRARSSSGHASLLGAALAYHSAADDRYRKIRFSDLARPDRSPVAIAAVCGLILLALFSWQLGREFLFPAQGILSLPKTQNEDVLMLGIDPAIAGSNVPTIDAESVPGAGQDSSAARAAGNASPAVAQSDAAMSAVALSTPNIDVSQFRALKVTKYPVRPGDSLSKIASRFGLTEDTLISFNHVSDVRRIQIGAVFSIPNRDGLLYTVQRGDSLSAIASHFGVAVNSILDANNLTSATIRPDQDLFIPGARMDPFKLKLALGEAFRLPVTSFMMTSPFGFRPDPFTGVRSFHNGIDMAGYYGQPIYAAGDGTVLGVGFNSIYGNYVVIGHSSSFQTLYGHMSKPLARRGEKVTAGERIGLMGSTGYSTGTHLHFSIYHNNQPVNPLLYLPNDSRLRY